MKHQPALFALIRLHAELGGKILDNKRQAERLASDMLHVEAVIHMLEPQFNLRQIAARRRNNANPLCKRGDITRAIMDVLREATEPLSSPEISRAVLASFGVAEPTRDDVRTMYSAVHSSLKNYAGKAVEIVGESRPARWRLLASVVPLPVAAEVHRRLGAKS